MHLGPGSAWLASYLLVGEVLPVQGVFQPDADLLSRDGVKVGRLEDLVDDGGVARLLAGGHYTRGGDQPAG